MILIVFNGENFLPEEKDSFDDEIENNTLFGTGNWWKAKYSDEARTLVRSGRWVSI